MTCLRGKRSTVLRVYGPGGRPVNIVSNRIDSDLGSWIHTEWRPQPDHPLAWVVRRIWDFEGWTAHRRERVFPNGEVELIVQLDERYHDVHGPVIRPTPLTCVTGIQTGAMVIQAPPRPCRVLGVRFHPLGAWAILQHPLSELTDVTADLHDLVGSAAGALAERCDDNQDPAGRVRRTIEWLCGRLQHSATVPRLSAAVGRVAERIAKADGVVRIGPLRMAAGLTTGQLAAAFREQIGVTPKRFARIHRFRFALGMLQSGASSLSRVALRAGYYDQPHMNAEFRSLAGLSPCQLLAAPRYPASTSTAES